MWPFKKRKTYISIGGEQIEVHPLSLEAAVGLVLLMAPYWQIIDENLPRIDQALARGDRGLLTEILFILRDKMAETPGDITKAVALLAGLDPGWVARKATAKELVEALPVLDKVHDLGRLWGIMQVGGSYLGER
jgi:hypothetical protein